MMRSWGLVTMTGAAQPCFGDVLTAAVTTPGPHTDITVAVASTTRYRGGDRIVLEPGTISEDTVLVETIPSSTVLLCRPEFGAALHAHANGAQILLSIACAEITVQARSTNANSIWMGTDGTITNVPAGSVIGEVYPSPLALIFQKRLSIGTNPIRTSDLWMAGTSPDVAIVSAEVV